MRRIQLTLLFLIPGVFCGRALSQQAASFQGIVVEASSGAPIVKAAVELRLAAASGEAGAVIATTHSDRDGKFYFPGAAPGQYRVVVNHAGHVRTEYPGVLRLTPGQRAADARIAMIAGGVVSGRIIDKGQPIGLADAVALRAIYTEGQLSLTPVLAVRTDDLGEYHLFWLPPGRYYIVGVSWDIANSVPRYVNPDGDNNNSFFAQRYIGRTVFLRSTAAGVGENEAHIPVYYPGTPDPKMARVIEIQPGAVLKGLDIDASAVLTRHVRGKVLGLPAQTGQAARVNVTMRLTSGMSTSSAQSPGALVDASGDFEINNAAPGRYMLTATAGNLTGRTLVEVVDRDVANVVVSLSAYVVSGRVVIERSNPVSPDPAMATLRVALRTEPLVPGMPAYAASPQPDGSFTIPAPNQPVSPPPGDYRVLVGPILVSATQPDSTPAAVAPLFQSLYVKSIRMGDVDVLNDRLRLQSQPQEPLTIVIGSNPGTVEGRVVDDRQQPAAGTTLVLVHDNGLRYRVNEKSTSSDSSGRFEMQNVPPGNYKLFAWQHVERGAWQDPDFMRSLEGRGVAVHVEEGRKVSVEVKVIEN